MSARVFSAGLLAIAALACDVRVPRDEPDWSLGRMIDQPRVRAYDPAPGSSGESAMRSPPEGTVPASDAPIDALRASGIESDGSFATEIPLPVTTALLQRGRARYDIVCATCHGITGNGDTVAAEKMTLRKPPSLHLERTKRAPPGRLYAIVKDGYGLMPAYRSMLSIDDRWAVVAYLRALWLSRGAAIASLPLEVRRDLEEHAR